MAVILSAVLVVVGLMLTGPAGSARAASEGDCAAVDDRRARLRCTDDYAVALGSRAKVAVRRLLKNPEKAVFSALRLVRGKDGDGLCGRFDLESDSGRMTGLQDFAFDDGRAYVLFKNAARDGVDDSSHADRIGQLGRDIEAFIALCGPGLPAMGR